MTYKQLTHELTELLEVEHGGCDQNTCDISSALRNGYALWALYLFDSCGASSDGFNSLYAKLPKRFQRDAEAERKEFCESVEHTTCPDCNAVIWSPDEVTNGNRVYCDSCGKGHEKGVSNETSA